MTSERRDTSVSAARESVNPRAALQTAILRDRTIPRTVRLLYGILDGYAGAKGFCWPSQERLAEDLGVTDRHVRRLLRRLLDLGLIWERRGQHGARYYLAWKYERDREILTGHSGDPDRTSGHAHIRNRGSFQGRKPLHTPYRGAGSTPYAGGPGFRRFPDHEVEALIRMQAGG